MNLLTLILNSWFFNNNGEEFFTIWSKGEAKNLIMTYTVCITIGIVLAVYLAFKEAKRLGVARSYVKKGLIIGIPTSIACARLIYVMFNWGIVTDGLLGFWHIFTAALDFQDGGLVLFGALGAGIAIILVFAKKYGINVLKTLDIMAPAILVVQIFNNFGNFFNNTTYGSETTQAVLSSFLPNFIVEGMNINGTYYHPLFLYEALWLFLGLVIILVVRRMKTKIQVGGFFGLYLVWYGLGATFIVELFRNDALMLGKVQISLIMSILILIGGIVYIAVKHNFFKQKTYFHAINEYREKSLQCYVFDLDQTLINAEKLINTAYAEAASKSNKISIYDDPRIALDGEKLKKYVQFTKDNHELLSEMYNGVKYALNSVKREKNEIIFVSKLPASIMAMKIHHWGLSGYCNRFINANDIGKLGREYNPFAIMVFSSDKKVLNFAARNGYKTAFCKFANPGESGVVSDKVLTKIADVEYIV